MKESVKKILWELICPKENFALNSELIVKMFIEGVSLDLDKQLTILSNTKQSEKDLNHLRNFVLENSYVGGEKYIQLAVFLYYKKFLSAIDFCGKISILSEENLGESLQNLVSTAKIVLHDFEEGFLDVLDDDVLLEALKDSFPEWF